MPSAPAPSSFGDLVFVLPGILGSRLVRVDGKRRKTVWDVSIKRLPRLLNALVKDQLVLRGDPLKEPDDGVEAVELFNYQLLPGFFGVDDYRPLVKTLRNTIGARQVLTFPYDWRASNRHAAARLAEAVDRELHDWRETSGNASAKVWLVGHSMGGLVARYYCEQLGGASQTRALVTIGTPHRGSVRALEALVNGKRLGPVDLTPLVRSLPSVYELLPLYPVVGPADRARRVAELVGLDPITGAQLAPAGTGLPIPFPQLDRQQMASALAFHRQIREPAERRAADGQTSPYEQHVFFNRRQPTPTSALITGSNVQLVEEPLGDGTVPAVAAVPIEWDDTSRAVPIGEKHAAMQATEGVRDALANWLQPLQTGAAKGVLDVDVVELGVDPVISDSDDLVVRLATHVPLNLHVEISNEDDTHPASPVRRAVRTAPGASCNVDFGRRPSGVQRVVVKRNRRVVVSDYVFVAGGHA